MRVHDPVSGKPAVVCTDGEGGADDLDAKLSRSWLRVGIAAVFAGQGMVFSLAVNLTPPPYGSAAYWLLHLGLMFSALVVLAFLGGPLMRSTFGMLRARRLSIEGLFTLSLTGAFIGSVASSLTGEGAVYYEVVAVVIAIYTVGRMVGERSQARLALQTEKLREHFEYAELADGSGAGVRVPVSELVRGSRVRVGPGAPFTVDGIVRSVSGYVRETALSGEPLPVMRRPGDRVRAGTWSADGIFEVEAERLEGEREIDGILRTVEDARGRPSELQTRADELIQAFLPLVAGVAAATAIFWAFVGTWVDAVLNSMAVLLVACPCALGLATPVAIWQGLYHLSRMGLVSRDGALIDALARSRHLFFDKTGTLSEPDLQVTEMLLAEDWQARRGALLAAVRRIERESDHPVGRSIAAGLAAEAGESPPIEELRLVPGLGVEAKVDFGGGGVLLRIGEPELSPGTEAALSDLLGGLRDRGGKRVQVFVAGRPTAVFVLKERPREGVHSLWEALENLGIRTTVLTGDPDPDLPLPREVPVRAACSAAEKAAAIRDSRTRGEVPVFVGDGLNDAPAMAEAAASIAMGGGTGLTRSVAGGELVADRVAVLPAAIRLCRGIHRCLRGNLIYAFAYNAVGMLLAAAGWLHPVAAALIMLVSSFWVTARALGGSSRGPGSRAGAD